jgi:nitrogen fixation protein NifB
MTYSIFSQDTTPCCDRETGSGIIQLSVAPQLTARTRFSAPPTKKRKVLSPAEALQKVEKCMAETPSVAMAAITGPGDPLATPGITFAVIRLIRNRFPQLPIGLLTMGIGGAELAGELIQNGVSYIEIQVEGVRREILEKIYAWIRPGAKTIKLKEGAELLLKEQRSAVSAFKFHGIKVVILTTLYPGCNVDHVTKISAEMMELGADGMALLPYFAEPDAEVELEEPGVEAVSAACAKAAAYLPPVTSLLVRQTGITRRTDDYHKNDKPRPSPQRPNAAVVSSNGIEVDLHLGHAGQFLVYGPRADGLVCLLETRKAPQPGSGNTRWQLAGDILKDCFVLLTASAGTKPCALLAEQGITVVISEENIEGVIDVLYGGGKKKKRSPATGPDTGEY